MEPRPDSSADEQMIARLVDHYKRNMHFAQTFLGQLEAPLINSPQLRPCVHSFKARLKDPEHLHDKLRRKLEKCRNNGEPFPYSADNLLVTINDLVGIRIIHLHSKQLEVIHAAILSIIDEYRFRLLESFARTWDDESRAFYGSLDLKTETSPNMYTSVHYIVGSESKSPITAEIQVRTLAEELWGEVDHTVNYPHTSTSQECREQLRVLARLVSSCTRLVDSIFLSASRESSKQ